MSMRIEMGMNLESMYAVYEQGVEVVVEVWM